MGSYDVFIADCILFSYTDPCEVRCLGNFDFSRNTRTNLRLFTFKASSTVAKYIREVRKFINFQEINSRPLLFPTNVTHLALYL